MKPGMRQGQLVLIRPAIERGRRYWFCQCDCGREIRVSNHSLVGRKQQHCFACFKVHGEGPRSTNSSAEYVSWSNARERCRRAKNYSGRGIRMCDEWATFEVFLKDMGRKPSPGHSLDRINNDGNYEPGNCRWATTSEQNINRRNVPKFDFHGERLAICEMARRVGLPPWLIQRRLARRARLCGFRG